MLVHFALVALAINAINLFYVQRTGRSIWHSQDAWIILAGLTIIGASFLLLRWGFYKPAVLLYIFNTAAVALGVPFAQNPNAEIGLLASATIPVLLTAMVFSYRWVVGVLLGVLSVGITLLSLAALPLREAGTGFALLLVVAVTGGLILVLRHHLDSLEKDRLSQVRKVAVKYQNLFENVADGIFIVDPSGCIVDVNSTACKQLDYTRAELIGSPVASISSRPDFDLQWLISELEQTGCLSYKTGHKRKDGSTFPVELSLSMVEHQGDISILGVARDITDQQAELSFREAVISHAAEGLCVCHQIAEFPYVAFSLWNDRMCEITGYTMEEINRLGWYQSVYPDPDLQARAIARMSEMRVGNNLRAEEWVITRKDGRERILEISTSMLQTSDNQVHVLALMHDVSARKQFEKDLSSSEKQYRELFDSVLEGIGLVDKNEIVLFANPAFARIFEFDTAEEIVGKSLIDYIADESREILREQNAMRARGHSSQYELAILTAKGNSKWIYLSVTPQLAVDGSRAGALAAVLDITDKRNSERLQVETQQKLEKAQRMESLGLLAGGVAHDLNNTLGPIVGYAEMLSREFPSDTKVGARLGKISKAAQDAALVIQDLLTLARRGRSEMKPTGVNGVIGEYLASPAFIGLQESRPDVVLQVQLDERIGSILGSEVHLSKAIMNLITNAYEAMLTGGTLTIRTDQAHLEELLSGHEVVKGEYVIVRVSDTGGGISSEDLEKIFEPYFSKKRMGRSGSGLGLSVVYGVVKDHHGYYDVFSKPLEGTEFVLYFPVNCEKAPQPVATRREVQVGTETILVVDDNADQLEMVAEILSSLGYTVHVAENGRVAVQFFTQGSVDLVLLDMIMEPDFDGLETYKAILDICPGQKAIIVSGYSATDRVRETLDLGASGYLKKPYQIQALATAVRSALDGSKVVETSQA